MKLITALKYLEKNLMPAIRFCFFGTESTPKPHLKIGYSLGDEKELFNQVIERLLDAIPVSKNSDSTQWRSCSVWPYDTCIVVLGPDNTPLDSELDYTNLSGVVLTLVTFIKDKRKAEETRRLASANPSVHECIDMAARMCTAKLHCYVDVMHTFSYSRTQSGETLCFATDHGAECSFLGRLLLKCKIDFKIFSRAIGAIDDGHPNFHRISIQIRGQIEEIRELFREFQCQRPSTTPAASGQSIFPAPPPPNLTQAAYVLEQNRNFPFWAI